MKLLVPTDFSKNAGRAIDYAAKIATKYGAHITLLHAYQIIDTASTSRKMLFEEYNYSIARKLHDEVKNQRNRIAKINPSIKITAELSDNTAKNAIINEGSKADLIVMGTQGATGLKRIFMGSVTASVIGDAIVPVLAIPRSYKWKEPKNILLAVNRFEENQKILDIFFNIARLFKTTLHVVIFTDSDIATPDNYLNDKSILDNYYDTLRKMNAELKVTSSHLAGSEFDDTLQKYIDENQIDIVAMITYKRNFLEKIFHRSATKSMMYHTQTPLLVIPGEAE